MGVLVKKADSPNGEYELVNSKQWKQSSIISCSAAAPLRSLDKAEKDWPNLIRIIVAYQTVHHANVLGNHIFNVDYANAARTCPSSLLFDNEAAGNKYYELTYDNNCPFFKDSQRELLLLMPVATPMVVGILAYAKDPNNCYLLSSLNHGENSNPLLSIPDLVRKEIGNLAKGKGKRKSDKQDNSAEMRRGKCVKFCLGENTEVDALEKKSMGTMTLEELEDLQNAIGAIRESLQLKTIYTFKNQNNVKNENR
jgi:hypothetical protein